MPLHLLGKKSWNVYNSTNIDRVRRDEAEAKAREDAEEQRMQEEDAQRRIAILRGETPPTLALADQEQDGTVGDHRHRDRKRRRVRGEDDTDRDIRYARQDSEAGTRARRALLRESDKDAALHDQSGNIQLFPAPDESTRRKTEKNDEAEAERVQKRKREEGRQSMRFSDAAGFSTSMDRPWYASRDSKTTAGDNDAVVLAGGPSKDVWGNEDPLRIERERNRLSINDPLAIMKRAQCQLKETERDREAWRKTQMAEFQRTSSTSRSRRVRHEKQRREDQDSVDEFRLDAPKDKRTRRRHQHERRRKESRHLHREDSCERNPHGCSRVRTG